MQQQPLELIQVTGQAEPTFDSLLEQGLQNFIDKIKAMDSVKEL